LLVESTREIVDQFFSLVGIIELPGLAQHPTGSRWAEPSARSRPTASGFVIFGLTRNNRGPFTHTQTPYCTAIDRLHGQKPGLGRCFA
jgi:hypothetical protein